MSTQLFLAEEEVRELRRALFGDRPEDFVENRFNQRHPFQVFQGIAPLIPGLRTTEQSFLQTLCNDVSANGISFFWPSCPYFRHVFIALGNEPNMNWIKARVIHHRKIDGPEGKYLVGCQFLERATSLVALLDLSRRNQTR